MKPLTETVRVGRHMLRNRLVMAPMYTASGPRDFVVPRALGTAEVAGIVDEYGFATRHALKAGFDGVELHAASGYLPEQFLSSGTNRRQDRYGGSKENRARFIIEVLTAMIDEAGSDRTGITSR